MTADREAAAFALRTRLETTDRAAVWAFVSSWAGVNEELAPVSMRWPARIEGLASIPADGRCHAVASIRCFGVPFDRHAFALVTSRTGEGFHEVSSSLWLRRWTHERRLTDQDGRIVVTDRCSLLGRVPGFDALTRGIYVGVFERRHARLRARFGGTAEDTVRLNDEAGARRT